MWQYHRFSVRLFLWPIKLKQQSQESRISFRDRFPFRPCVVPSIDKRWNMALNVYMRTHTAHARSRPYLLPFNSFTVCVRARCDDKRWQPHKHISLFSLDDCRSLCESAKANYAVIIDGICTNDDATKRKMHISVFFSVSRNQSSAVRSYFPSFKFVRVAWNVIVCL